LRKWALREDVPSYLEKTPVGQLRMVSLEGIHERAAELGRKIETRVVTPAPSAITRPVVDLTDDAETAAAQPALPEGTMLVPLDAWNKMLNQLGNLHEAGQQLAEARERAAKAETQAVFLRERLAELREELATEKQRSVIHVAEHAAADSPPPPEPTPRSASLAAYPAAMTRQLWATWKVRRRRR
jgi:dsDNA-binding SOS-regulon protein